MSENTQNRVSWPVPYGEGPKDGSRALYQLIDFTQSATVEINLTFEQESGRLEFVQALFVDNSSNNGMLICNATGTNQFIKIPPGYQGYVPVLATSSNPKIKFTTTATNTPIVPVHFLSFPVPLALWSASGDSTAGSVGTDYSSAAGVTAIATVIAGDTLLSTVPVNATRNYLEVQNQSVDTIYLIRDNGAGASPSMTILAPAAIVGAQGGAWSDNYFRGRLRVYSSGATSQFSVREE